MGAIIRVNKTHVVVLCPMGHLIESWKLNEISGGSMIAAELGSRHEGDRFDKLANVCKGHGHN